MFTCDTRLKLGEFFQIIPSFDSHADARVLASRTEVDEKRQPPHKKQPHQRFPCPMPKLCLTCVLFKD